MGGNAGGSRSMLAPTLIIIIVLFFGSMVYGLLQSLGYQPNIGNTTISLDAYIQVLISDLYRYSSGMVCC